MGSIIEFGTYEQDGDATNGKEPIQWRVKAVDDNKLTLLSEYGLDAKKFNEESASVSWEMCTLRTWLNGEFYQSSFSESEKTKIVNTHRDNKAGNDKYAKDTNPTDDNVWILSYGEADAYFSDKKDQYKKDFSCTATAQAIANGASVSEDGKASWWLSTSAMDGSVDCAYGSVISKTGVTVNDVCVRPSITIAV